LDQIKSISLHKGKYGTPIFVIIPGMKLGCHICRSGGFGPAEKQTTMDAIKTANITPDVASKYGYKNKADLINTIDADFNIIFQVQ
jgi:hypothetical protein